MSLIKRFESGTKPHPFRSRRIASDWAINHHSLRFSLPKAHDNAPSFPSMKVYRWERRLRRDEGVAPTMIFSVTADKVRYLSDAQA